jgi:pSer/pThr/pTyr-binding forkhead associated (FHA) protein
MSENGRATAPPREVIVQLLDPTYRRPIKSWKFTGKTIITIGRAEDRDIEISDAYVSRLHAELLFKETGWVLISRGRNGVIVGGRPITEIPVETAVQFRLGSEGPTLRFSTGVEEEETSNTLCFETQVVPLFRVDESKVREEVGQIASGDYFQSLQQKAEELRRRRSK